MGGHLKRNERVCICVGHWGQQVFIRSQIEVFGNLNQNCTQYKLL